MVNGYYVIPEKYITPDIIAEIEGNVTAPKDFPFITSKDEIDSFLNGIRKPTVFAYTVEDLGEIFTRTAHMNGYSVSGGGPLFCYMTTSFRNRGGIEVTVTIFGFRSEENRTVSISVEPLASGSSQ